MLVYSLTLPPIPRKVRSKIHVLASYYQLESQSMGYGQYRFPTLHRTPHTCMADRALVAALVAQDDSRTREAQTPRRPKGGSKKRKAASEPVLRASSGKGKGGRAAKFVKSDAAAGGGNRQHNEALRPTGIVGSGAPRIHVSNVGSQLLRSMGWDGGALGSSQTGATEPIAVTIKYDKRGLGFD